MKAERSALFDATPPTFSVCSPLECAAEEPIQFPTTGRGSSTDVDDRSPTGVSDG